jgi:hypothetical protein
MEVRTPQAARFLGYATGTLERWRYDRPDGPPYLKRGGLVLYDLDQLAKWAAAHTVPSGESEGVRRRSGRSIGDGIEPGGATGPNAGRTRSV